MYVEALCTYDSETCLQTSIDILCFLEDRYTKHVCNITLVTVLYLRTSRIEYKQRLLMNRVRNSSKVNDWVLILINRFFYRKMLKTELNNHATYRKTSARRLSSARI